MTIPVEGAYMIAKEEGIVPARYKDAAGVDTFGIGHTRAAGVPDPATMSFAMPTNVDGVVKEAIRLFRHDLEAYEREVTEAFGRMTTYELAGWTSWHFNTGGVHSSRAAAMWKAGDHKGAVRVMQTWNKITVRGKKQVSPGLVERRKVEADLILKGRYPEPGRGVPIWPTDGKGKVKWTPLGFVTLAEYRAATDFTAYQKPDMTTPVAVAVGTAVAVTATFWDKIEEMFKWLTSLFS